MKKIFIYLFAILLGAVACHKEYTIYPYAQFDQCLAPTEVSAKVVDLTVTLKWKTYPDAKTYYVEIYNEVPGNYDEPSPSALIDSLVIPSSEVPYTFRGPKDTRCFYRVKAQNPNCKDSRWVTGTFKTDVDPLVTCKTPGEVTADAFCEMVVFSWEPSINSTAYELEIYSSAIPFSGEPDPANLVHCDTLALAQVPDTVWFPAYETFYYRVRATAPGTTLEPSKWTKGSFETMAFVWPNDNTAVDRTAVTVQDYSGTCDNGSASPFTATNKSTTANITLNKFTYGHKCTYITNTTNGSRVQLGSTSQAADFSSQYGAPVPTKNFLSFNVVTPGTLETYLSSTTGAEACVVLLTNKTGVGKKAKYLQKGIIPHTTYFTTGQETDKFVVTKGDLYGISSAATVYIYASNYKALHVMQVTWTPSSNQ